MCKKKIVLVAFVAVLCLVGRASADLINWTNGAGDRDWCIGGNWDSGVPGPNDTANVSMTPLGPIIGTGCDANVVELRGPYPFGPNTIIDIEGDGSLYVQNDWVLTRAGSGTVAINITDSAVVSVMGTGSIHLSPDRGRSLFTVSGNADAYFGGGLSAGDKTGTDGDHVLSILGGRLQTGGGFGFGHDMAGGVMNVSGADTEIYIGGGLGFYARRPPAKITLNMDGGLLDVAGAWEVGAWSDEDWTDPWAVKLYLNGGRIICGNFVVQVKPEYPDGIPFLMDIDEGAVLEIRRADIAPTIRGWIDREPPFITGKDGTVKPKVAIVRGHTLVGFNLVQYEASNPSPGDAVGDVCPVGLTLSWDAGDYADQHKVYFGSDFNDVNDGTIPEATKSLGDETYDPGWLDYGQTYYWRVDEVNLTEPNEWKGVTWSFNTHSGKAENPSPFNGQRGFMSGSTQLDWDRPCYLTGQTLSYGDTFPQDGTWTEVELGPLEDSYTIATARFKNYYWRVDVNDGNNTITGDDWYFRTGWGGLLLHFKFDGVQGNDLPSPITDDSGNGLEFTKYTDGGSVKYGESNPDNVLSTASGDFEADAGLYRDDPCDPCEETPDLLRLDGSEYTVEVWLKPRKWTDLGTIWLLYKDGGWGLAINSLPGCGDGDCDASYRWMSNGSWTALTEDDTAKKDEWVHLAVVRDEGGDLGGIFLNGIEQEEGDTGGSGGQNPADNDSPVWIGAGGLAGGGFRAGDGFYDGLMDELRIHDIALAPCAFLLGPSDPEYPICPSPADNEMQVDPCSVVLSWTPGESATSHKVYFSTDVGAVEDVSATTLIYNGPNTSVPLTPLEYGTTYYWRVVEQPGGEEGDVWKFTTAYVVE
ncbi:MAG: LamG-like jellyroll fold domain-containing protein, partial [Planctomycetota bacterium]